MLQAQSNSLTMPPQLFAAAAIPIECLHNSSVYSVPELRVPSKTLTAWADQACKHNHVILVYNLNTLQKK